MNESSRPNRGRSGRGRKIALGVLRLAIGAALLAVLATTGALDWAALSGLVEEWRFTAAAAVLFVSLAVVTAWRLCLLLRPRGYALGLRDSLRLTLIGMFFNVAMPGSSGGDLVRIYYAAKGNEGRRAEIVTILLLDRFIGMVALLLYPLICAPLYLSLITGNEALRAVVLTSAGLIVALVLFVWIVFARGGGRVLAQRVFARIPGADVIRRGVSTLQSYGSDRRPLWQALGASLFAQGMGVTCFVLLTRATVSPSLEWGLFVIVPIGLVVNTVPLTPGGLGVGEAAFAVLFGMIGLQGGPEVLIAWRLLSIVVGLAGLYFYLRGRKQFVSTRERARGADDPPPSSSGATPPQRHAVAGSTLAPGGLDA